MRDLTEVEFKNLVFTRCTRRKEVVALASPALLAVTRTLLPVLGGSELAVLMCLLSLTVASGRVARDVSVREFCEGMHDDEKNIIVCGTGLSENSVRTAIKSLDEKGLVSVYREVRRDGKDCAARIYEINFTRLDMILAVRLRALWTPNTRTDPFKLCRGVHISNYVTGMPLIEATSSFIPVAVGSGNNVKGKEMAYVGKKVQPATAPKVESAAGVIAAVQQRSRAKVAVRAEAAIASPTATSREQMQALFDVVGQRCAVPYRLMVTAKEFGFLRKRIAQNPPQDLEALLQYSLTYWGVLAQQNRKAARKSDDKAKVVKALPEAPHFQTFAYWYPYFFRAYQNHLAGRNAETMPDADDRRVRQLEKELQDSRSVIVSMRRRMQPSTQAAPTPQVRRRPAPVNVADELPEWK